ncbi:MAG: di-heme oxidoredictase family protein [Myxococcales bacterium]|nr:c-type cytochrome [Polyangiaceae bacterium]MDW8249205.1 di-heme oxidoredictase family protein [Myxococcales bacterium]
MTPHAVLLWLLVALVLAACEGEEPGASPPTDDPTEPFSGGNATVFDVSTAAFSHPVPGLSPEREEEFFVGNALFNRGWVTAPASVVDMDGLGPLYNATSCSGCHFKDGRGRPPEKPGERFLSLLLRLSTPGISEYGASLPEPTYGGQLQGSAILGVIPEGEARVTYAEISGTYGDGDPWALRVPTYTIENLGYGPLHPQTMVSPRVAPQMIGLGLLEAIPEASILALADPDDRDGDGVSGRPNRVWDVAAQRTVLGRFGWKANQPSLRQQTLGAFNGDMGITSSLFPGDHCTEAQLTCREAKNGGEPELREEFADAVVHYTRTLAVPARRRWKEEEVRRGKELFAQARCTSCHTERFTTGAYPEVPELENQPIRPYTDLLLHDMGEGLADGRPDYEATGSEWRTPPLWGIGLFHAVNRHTYYLHDGRARNLAEAILWHGGEAQASRDAFVRMPRGDREALLAFLGSL